MYPLSVALSNYLSILVNGYGSWKLYSLYLSVFTAFLTVIHTCVVLLCGMNSLTRSMLRLELSDWRPG